MALTVKITRSTITLIGFSFAFALLHYAVFTVSYVRAEVIHPESGHVWSQRAAEIFAFPLVYLAKVPLPIDVFPIAVIANSLLWGIVCTAAVIGARRIARGEGGKLPRDER
jgi:hypothetical protein